MQAQQRIFCSRELTLGQQPTLIAERKTGHLIRQFQLQLLAPLSQRRAELKEMPLNQAGGCSNGQNDPLERTDEILAQEPGYKSFLIVPQLRC